MRQKTKTLEGEVNHAPLSTRALFWERETLQDYGFSTERRPNSEPLRLEVVRSSLAYDPQLVEFVTWLVRGCVRTCKYVGIVQLFRDASVRHCSDFASLFEAMAVNWM